MKKAVLKRINLLVRHLQLVDVQCETVQGASENCRAGSHLSYKCKSGYKFETNQEVFNAKCKYNKWERIPRCLPGDNRLIIIEKLDFSKS